jgi:hypothetical protein
MVEVRTGGVDNGFANGGHLVRVRLGSRIRPGFESEVRGRDRENRQSRGSQ